MPSRPKPASSSPPGAWATTRSPRTRCATTACACCWGRGPCTTRPPSKPRPNRREGSDQTRVIATVAERHALRRVTPATKPKELDMIRTQERSKAAIETPKAQNVDMKLEIVVIPVSDVDRAKAFYGSLGWRLDAHFAAGDDFRVIQFTPPGSGRSVIFVKNVTAAAPGSAQGLYLIVSDIAAARSELRGRGVAVSEAFHDAGGVYAGPNEPYLFGRLRIGGADPEHRSYRSFASFSDPDGNGWLLQEITARLPR